jgi:glycosyltransferase involved in cell wall biosynthesis
LEQLSEKPLNILFISSWYPNSEQPTLGNFVQKHAQAAAGYNKISVITVVSSSDHKAITIDKRIERNVHEYIAYFPKYKGLFSKAFNFIRNRKAFLNAYNTFISEQGQAALVHLNVTYPLGLWALWLKRKKGIPYVLTEHSSGFHIGTDHAYPPHILSMCKKVLNGAEVILPVSRDLEKSLKKLEPQGTYEIISNVVDEHIFQRSVNQKNDEKRFIHISTGVDPIKNLSGMIRAFDQLSKIRQDWTLDIVSDGDVEYLKKLVLELDHPELINFHSTRTTEQIAEMLQQSDALILFSNYENFPCVIPEAFMTGKPVISTSVNGIPEHVNSNNGILVDRGNEKQLVDAIQMILNNEFAFDSVAIRHYAMEHFSYTTVGKKLDTIYRKVLTKKAQ